VSKGFFSGNPTIRLQKYTPQQKFIGVEYADNDAGFLERTIDGNDTTYVGHGAVPLMLVGEQNVKTTSKNQNDPMLPKLRKAFNVLGYKNGGFIDCLRAGGKTYAECKKCGGKTPVQNAGLGDILGRIFGTNEPVQTREPGTRPSSAGVFQPDYVKRDDAL
jgi:hypothetical protein